MVFEEKTYRSGGVSMKYFEGGSGKTILFLQGGVQCTKTYGLLLNELVKTYHVIAPDLPFFGRSSSPKNVWDFIDYGKFLNGFLQERQLKEVTIVGHSFGAGVGVALSLESKSVVKLLLIDATGISLMYPLWQFYFKYLFMQHINIIVYTKRILPLLGMIKDFFANFLKNPVDIYRMLLTVNTSVQKECLVLDRVSVPTLLLWGEKDEFLPRSYAERYHKEIKDSQLHFIPGAPHNWIVFKPDACLTALRSFVEMR